ncbi:hypothetical protein HK414_22535 [Ramlibacter terrae]|uniref:Uncharacterized protein n=1 Tax=Ramlibacter terrae TaxID=2732511 RepID=A0ABX6P8A1_9BURK|nr:hypothetical protein HK414_22535 [Ramlibacter terrae]
MATATRYLIGKGELLTFGIDAPKKKPSEKKHPYTLAEAKATLIPQLEAANAAFSELPDGACPDDQAVARITLHPAYIAKSYFPRVLLQQAGLVSVGSRNRRIRPRKVVAKTAPAEADTTELFVAGPRSALRRLMKQARLLTADMAAAHEFAQIESIEPMMPSDRLRPAGEGAAKDVFEVGLHIPLATLLRVCARSSASTPRSAGSEWMTASSSRPGDSCSSLLKGRGSSCRSSHCSL